MSLTGVDALEQVTGHRNGLTLATPQAAYPAWALPAVLRCALHALAMKHGTVLRPSPVKSGLPLHESASQARPASEFRGSNLLHFVEPHGGLILLGGRKLYAVWGSSLGMAALTRFAASKREMLITKIGITEIVARASTSSKSSCHKYEGRKNATQSKLGQLNTIFDHMAEESSIS